MSDLYVVADLLGVQLRQADIDSAVALRELVDLARHYGNDCGVAALAGLWMGQGMPTYEIIARLWPHHQRFTIADGGSSGHHGD